MDMSAILVAAIIFLSASAFSIILFERLGFGVILGSIVAGVIIGPYTAGPVPIHAVEELQSIAELGVVLFMFTVGLEMRPEKVWGMRRNIFGLGSAQMLVTAAFVFGYVMTFMNVSWETATIVGLAFAMSSTAMVMATLGERSELGTEHGRTIFAILMAQDLWIVPVMALIPILAHTQAQPDASPLWEKGGLVCAVLSAIFVAGRYILPTVLGYCARRRQMGLFGLVLFLAVLSASWGVEHVGISMTLGAFLLGMLLSASDLRYQVEASVAPFKTTLMGLFFVSVGMSIDVGALLHQWDVLIIHVPAIIGIKCCVVACLVFAFKGGKADAVRVGAYLCQVGELAFVLLGASAVAGLLSNEGHTLAMLVVAVSMVATPLLIKLGVWVAGRVTTDSIGEDGEVDRELKDHVVLIGYEEVGQLLDFMLEKAGVTHIAIDKDIDAVRFGSQLGRKVYFGNAYSSFTREIAAIDKASAVYVTLRKTEDAKALSVTLQRLYPDVDVHVRVRTLAEQEEMAAKGIRYAGTDYIESTLMRGRSLLTSLGVSEGEVNELVQRFQQNDYQEIRASYGLPQVKSKT